MVSPVKTFRLPSQTLQMLAELSEQTGMSPSAVVRASIAVLHRMYHQPVWPFAQQTTAQGQPVQGSDKKKKKHRKHN